MTQLNIKRVQKDASPQVLEICRESALWMKKMGIVQWDDFFDEEKARLIMERRFQEGEVFLGLLSGATVATITLQWEDSFWGDLGMDPDSGYIHTMAVSRGYAGRGFGRELLEWAGAYFSKAGRSKMRLDVFGNNSRLCRYYDDLEFKTIAGKDWKDRHLLMKERTLS